MSALPARTTAAAVGGGSRLPDLRLVPAALATWVVVLLGLYTGPAGGAVAGGLAGGALVAALRGSRRAGPAAAVVVAAAGAALAAGLVVTAHTLALHMHPLHAAAERGAAATLTVVVRDDPHALRSGDAAGRPGAAQVLVPATLRAAETGGRRWTGGGRVLLIAPAVGWSALLPGQEVGADGLLAPATRADLKVAHVIAGREARSVRAEEQRLKALVAEVTSMSCEQTVWVSDGARWSELAQVVAASPSALLVVGAHPRSRRGLPALGMTCLQLLEAPPCPLLLLRSDERSPAGGPDSFAS